MTQFYDVAMESDDLGDGLAADEKHGSQDTRVFPENARPDAIAETAARIAAAYTAQASQTGFATRLPSLTDLFRTIQPREQQSSTEGPFRTAEDAEPGRLAERKQDSPIERLRGILTTAKSRVDIPAHDLAAEELASGSVDSHSEGTPARLDLPESRRLRSDVRTPHTTAMQPCAKSIGEAAQRGEIATEPREDSHAPLTHDASTGSVSTCNTGESEVARTPSTLQSAPSRAHHASRFIEPEEYSGSVLAENATEQLFVSSTSLVPTAASDPSSSLGTPHSAAKPPAGIVDKPGEEARFSFHGRQRIIPEFRAGSFRNSSVSIPSVDASGGSAFQQDFSPRLPFSFLERNPPFSYSSDDSGSPSFTVDRPGSFGIPADLAATHSQQPSNSSFGAIGGEFRAALSKTNELLQQLLEETRRSRSAFLPSAAKPVYSER